MYNSLSRLPLIPYNILLYLASADTAENMWKLLKYNDYDCLSHPNLTFDEKIKLIWKNGNQEKYSLFLTPLVEDAITESKTIIKIYNYYIHNSDLYNSTVIYAFDCLYGGNMSLIDYEGIPASRGDVFINTILATLNGAEVQGIGKLMFNDNMSRYTLGRATIGNGKTFTGVQLYLSTMVGDTGAKNPCDD